MGKNNCRLTLWLCSRNVVRIARGETMPRRKHRSPVNQKAANSIYLAVFAGVRPRQAGLLFFFAANSELPQANPERQGFPPPTPQRWTRLLTEFLSELIGGQSVPLFGSIPREQ